MPIERPPASEPPGPEPPAARGDPPGDAVVFEARDAYRARNLREMAAPLSMFGAMGAQFPTLNPQVYVLYREALLHLAGRPRDPIEVMLLEQLALAHLAVGRLHMQCGQAKEPEAARVYGQLAISLTGELRRTALALKEYRGGRLDPPNAKQAGTPPIPPWFEPSGNGGVGIELGNTAGGKEVGDVASEPEIA